MKNRIPLRLLALAALLLALTIPASKSFAQQTFAQMYSISAAPLLGPMHNGFIQYFYDSTVGTSFPTLALSAQGNRYEQLYGEFLADATDVSSSYAVGTSSLWQEEFVADTTNSNYSNLSWWVARGDTAITALSLAPGEDAACRALLDSLANEPNNATLSLSLTAMQTAWQIQWSTVDNYGANGSHDWIYGGMLSVAISSHNLWSSGGPSGSAPCSIWSFLADVVGFGVGAATSDSTSIPGKCHDGEKTAEVFSNAASKL